MAIKYEYFRPETRQAELVGRLSAVEQEHFRLSVDANVVTTSGATPVGGIAADEEARKARLADLEKDHKALKKLLADVEADLSKSND